MMSHGGVRLLLGFFVNKVIVGMVDPNSANISSKVYCLKRLASFFHRSQNMKDISGMREIIQHFLWSALLLTSLSVSAQESGEWWLVEENGLQYQLPASWASDPFSSSSVCDCPGTINDNSEWAADKYVGMVIYPVSAGEQDTSDLRQQVWGYGFVPGDAGYQVEYAGIQYTANYGVFDGMASQPKVWQLVTTESVSNKFNQLIVYFWSNQSEFERNTESFISILESFKRTKVRR